MTDCVFCEPNWPNLDIVYRVQKPGFRDMLIINPLKPVTPGHVLVISNIHSANAAAGPAIFGGLSLVAATWVQDEGIQANIITSVGPDATQTVMHTHVHVVPRRAGDGLVLPWTTQADAMGWKT